MALFNFGRPESNSNNSNEVVRLVINEETIEVPMAEAQGKTVAEVFAKFASDSCDVARINRYVAQGRIVSGNSPVEANTVYSGAITSESKG